MPLLILIEDVSFREVIVLSAYGEPSLAMWEYSLLEAACGVLIHFLKTLKEV